MSIILFFVILLILVLVHEFGHFIAAKKSGIRVDEFGFGFPPKLFGVKKGETEYTFNALPFGGFVKIFGETPDEASTSGADSSRSLVNKPKYIQAMVLFAGVFFNLLLAWLLLSAGFATGLPASSDFDPNVHYLKAPALTITSVLDKSPAQAAGLQIGDTITALSAGDETVEEITIESVQQFISSHPGTSVTLAYERKGIAATTAVVPAEGVVEDHAGVGISMDMVGILKLPIHKALWQGMKLTGRLTVDTVVSLAHLIRDSVAGHANFSSLTGPVGLVGVVGDAYQFGFVHLLSLMALISINLAVINLIPFPALDGGRLLFLLIEKIKGSPIKPRVANIMNVVGFCLLIGLMLVVTYHDIARLVK